MASTDAIPVPRKNTAFRFSFALRKPSDSTLITTWAGMDSEVSLDGAAYSDCTNEATEIGTSGTGYIDLTSGEMNADCVLLKITFTNTGAVPLVFALYPESAGDYRVADTQKVDVETIKTQTLTAAAGITFGVYVGGTAAAAVASTALSTATWTGTLATNIGTTNTTVAGNLDAAITSRMATYTQPTGFLAATFPLTVASTTNITAGTITTTTNLTNLPSITSNWITAAGIATDAIGATEIAAAAANKIADHILRRLQTNVEASSDGDTLGLGSLYGLIQQGQESAASGTTLTVYKTDGTTSLGTKTLSTNAAADPVDGIS